MKQKFYPTQNLPPVDPDWGSYSISVLVKTKAGEYHQAWYSYERKYWYYIDSTDVRPDEIEAWWYLPE